MSSEQDVALACECRRVAKTLRPEICVNVTTVIKYLLPGSATANAGVLRPKSLRSTIILLAAVIVTIASRPETATLAITLRPAGGGWPRWTDGLFVCGRDNFSWEV